jgi:O-antigen/teichoic acid export membrane protein
VEDTARRSTRSAIFWSAVETFGHQGVQLVVFIVLARLVSPADFGLVAMLTVFYAVGQILADGGYSNALIQKKDADDLDRSTIFYFNMLAGIVLSLALFLAAAPIAAFFDEPRLQLLAQVMCLAILASAVGIIQQANTRKDLDFQVRAKAAMSAALLAGTTSVALAVAGAGVWALVAQLILVRLFQSIFLWWFCSWRPIRAFSAARLRTMFGFGSKMLVAGMISAFFNNLIALVTGRFYSAVDVGYYDVARRYQEYPANNLTTVFSRVSFPAFSRAQHNPVQLQHLFIKTLRASSSAVFPVMGLLCGVAHPLFETLLGAQWLPSVPLFQVLCVIGLFQPISAINLNLLLAQGRSGHFLALEVIKRSLAVLAILLTFRSGVFWMVVGTAVACAMCFFVKTYFTAKYLAIASIAQLRIVAKQAAMAVVVGAVAYACTLLATRPVWSLCLGLIAGTATGIAFLGLFDRKGLSEAWSLLRMREPGAASP